MNVHQTGQSCKKINLFWDVDDVILKSSETVIDIINKNYLIPNNKKTKTFKDLKDWGYRSIYRNLTDKDLIEIFESEYFHDNVKINETFIQMIQCGILKNFNNYFVTYGTEESHKRKKEVLKREFKKYGITDFFNDDNYIGLIIGKDTKDSIDMSNGIQIDDNMNFMLNGNSDLKILVTNGVETDYNHKDLYWGKDDVYVTKDLGEVLSILDFIITYGLKF